MTLRQIAWTPDGADARVRVPRFVRRSLLALEEVATVANAMRATFESLFASQVSATIVPPVELADGDWQRLCEGRRSYILHGESRDGVLLIDDVTARRIVAAAFSEDALPHPLSRLEAHVLERCLAQVAGALRSLCGTAHPSNEAADAVPVTYFELRFGPPADSAVGIALAAPLQAAERAFLHADLLDECPVECWVRLGSGAVNIFTFASLGVGDVVQLETKVGAYATLNLGAEAIAAGEGGILGDRTAFKVHELI